MSVPRADGQPAGDGHVGEQRGEARVTPLVSDRRLVHMTGVFVAWIGLLVFSGVLGLAWMPVVLLAGVALFTIWSVSVIVAGVRETQRMERALMLVCPGCTYDLCGSRGDVCPECGRPLEVEAIRLRSRMTAITRGPASSGDPSKDHA